MILRRYLCLLPFILICPVLVQSQDQQPVSNIVLITFDDLGQELGVLGDTLARTPFLDSLANSSVNFSNAYVTQSSCSPSRASILTGLYPFQHGQIGLANANTEFKLKNHIIPLPRILSENGFYNSVIGKIHVEDQNSIGFDFKDGRTEKTRESTHVLNVLESIYQNHRDKRFTMINLYDPHVNREKSFPDQVNNIPNPLFEATNINPLPYQMVDDEEQLSRVASYYNAVARVDHLVDQIFNFFQGKDLLDRTLFIILSDNGAPFNRAKTSNYEAGVKTPLIIVAPNQNEALQVDKLVSAIDIMPTILEYAQIEIPSMLAGRSLKPLVDGRNIKTLPVFTEFHYHTAHGYYPRKALRYENWKLIHNLDTTLRMPYRFVDNDQSGRLVQGEAYLGTQAREVMDRYYNPPEYELYDLSTDPYELSNLSYDASHVAKLAELKNKLQPQFPDSISRQFRNVEGTIMRIFDQYLIDSIWISPEHDHEQFEIFNRKKIRRLPLNGGDTINGKSKTQYKIIINGKNGYGGRFNLLLNLNAVAIPTIPKVEYGPESRQFLDLHLARSNGPSPVYFEAHGNGGNVSMPQSIVDELNETGISVVSWESIPSLRNIEDVEIGWNDAELMIDWVKKNAHVYNLDTTKFLVGGSSRGSIISWKIAHNQPNIQGIYMYNALPDAIWNHPDWWSPSQEINTNSPPLFLVFEDEPGSQNGHDPRNGLLIADIYDSLGIDHLDTIVHSIGSSLNTDKYQFLIDFICTIFNKPPVVLNTIPNTSIDEDQGTVQIAEISSVFKDPENAALQYHVTHDFEDEVVIAINNGYLEATPSVNYNGIGTVRITASDSSQQAESSFQLTINPVNDAPRFTLSQDFIEFDETSDAIVTIDILPEIVPNDELNQKVTYTFHSEDPVFVEASISENTVLLSRVMPGVGNQNFTIIADDGQIENNVYSVTLSASLSLILSSDAAVSETSIYPNPAQETLFLKSDKAIDIRIYSLSGQTVFRGRVTKLMDISHLKAGIYIVKIIEQGVTETHQIIKTNSKP